MALTVGTGPFGHAPAGTFNFELPRTKGLIYFEDTPRRIRARLGAETVVDSRHAKLLHERGLLPILAFFNERVDIEADGEPQERPVTQFSTARSRLSANA